MKRQLLSVLLALIPSVGASTETVTIPKGCAVIVDGVEGEHEWDDAGVVALEGGEYLKVKHDGEHLLLSIRGEKLGISSVAIHADNEVKIFHASAGLITATYTEQGGHWVQIEEFRSGRQSLVRAERNDPARIAKNLELFGWCANILPRRAPADFDHRNITEYMISLGLLQNGVSTMSVVFSQRTAKLPMARAPEGLADDSLHKPMVHGSNVESLHFEPDTWLKLQW